MISYIYRGYDLEVNQFASIETIIDIARKMQLDVQIMVKNRKFLNLELTTKNYVPHNGGIYTSIKSF